MAWSPEIIWWSDHDRLMMRASHADSPPSFSITLQVHYTLPHHPFQMLPLMCCSHPSDLLPQHALTPNLPCEPPTTSSEIWRPASRSQRSWLKSAAFRAVKERLKIMVVSWPQVTPGLANVGIAIHRSISHPSVAGDCQSYGKPLGIAGGTTLAMLEIPELGWNKPPTLPLLPRLICQVRIGLEILPPILSDLADRIDVENMKDSQTGLPNRYIHENVGIIGLAWPCLK